MADCVLYYARALYSYQPADQTEIAFNESDVVSVLEDCGDGWWRAQLDNSTGRVPANYFEVVDNTQEESGGYSYEYSTEGYDYGAGGESTAQQTTPTSPTLQDNKPSTSSSSSSSSTTTPAQSSIADSPAYVEQMKMWGNLMNTQKQEKAKLEKQIADSELALTTLRKETFYFKQLDFILQEVLKLETEIDLDLDASIHFQRVQLAITRDVKSIKDTIDTMKLENQQKKHIDDKLEDFNTKLNNSLQLLENCDKTRKVFYGDLTALQSFLEDVEKRKRAEEERQRAEDAEWE